MNEVPEAEGLQAFKLDVGEFRVGLSNDGDGHIILVCKDQAALVFPLEAARKLHDYICVALGILEEGEFSEEIPSAKNAWN